MSDDLIKRKYAMYALCNGCEKFKQCITDNENWCDKGWVVRRGIPSEDRPSGEWVPCTKNGLPLTELGRREGQKWYGYKCSRCNFIYKGNALIESPFCQNCGCRMKGADDETD